MNKTTVRTVRITITTTAQVKEYLERLIPLGLYGTSTAEVAERLLCESLRSDMRRRKVGLLEGTGAKEGAQPQ